jgi:hypothetical protein
MVERQMKSNDNPKAERERFIYALEAQFGEDRIWSLLFQKPSSSDDPKRD